MASVVLESVPDMQVIGEATTGSEVMAQAASLQPDIVENTITSPLLTHKIAITLSLNR